MSVKNLIEDVEHRTSQANGERPRFQATRHVAAYVVIDSDGTAVEVQGHNGTFDLRDYPRSMAMQIQISDHKPFQFPRLFLGSILPNGKFVVGVDPFVEDLRTGQPAWDNTYHNIETLANASRVWHEREVSFQMGRYSARRGGDVEVVVGKHMGKTERNRARGKAKPKTA